MAWQMAQHKSLQMAQAHSAQQLACEEQLTERERRWHTEGEGNEDDGDRRRAKKPRAAAKYEGDGANEDEGGGEKCALPEVEGERSAAAQAAAAVANGLVQILLSTLRAAEAMHASEMVSAP